MKQLTKTKIVWVTDDGVEFDTEHDCLIAEANKTFHSVIGDPNEEGYFNNFEEGPCISDIYGLIHLIDKCPQLFVMLCKLVGLKPSPGPSTSSLVVRHIEEGDSSET